MNTPNLKKDIKSTESKGKLNLYAFFYMLLIAVTILSPDEHGTTLKYAIIPLAGVVLFALLQKRSIKLMIPLRFFILVFAALMFFSTRASLIVEMGANFRSTLIMVGSLFIVCGLAPSQEQMSKIKLFYVICTVFCGLMVLFEILRAGFSGIDRQNFNFIWGLKDVNYLLAFMLPGCYFASRNLVIEKNGHKLLNVLCVFLVIISILALQTRAAFVTVIIFSGLLFIEYNVKTQLSKKKLAMFVLIIIAVALAIIFLINSPQFERLTNFDEYEDNIRLTLWKHAFQAFRNHPVFGSGLGSGSLYSIIAKGLETHNNFVDIICDFGMVGISVFAFMILCLLSVKKGCRLHMISYITACLVPLAFINGFQTIVFWLPLIMLAHECTILSEKKEKKEKGKSKIKRQEII